MKTSHKFKFVKIFSLTNIIAVIIIFLMMCLIISPLRYIQSASNGIELWARHLLPSLFPFFVLCKILMDLNIFDNYSNKLNPIMNCLFGLNGKSSYIFFISLLCGYPLGSKLVSDAYLSGKINQTQAYRLTTITSVSGPLFIIGTVGSSMLFSAQIGYIMLISHILGALLNGFTYKKYTPKFLIEPNYIVKASNTNKNILTTAINSSIQSILYIGGLVCIFYVAMQAISEIIPLHPIIQGIIEITNGCHQVSLLNYTDFLKAIICCGIITFGGFCTHAQAMFFLKQANIKYSFFVKQKITHTIYAILICAILCLLLKI